MEIFLFMTCMMEQHLFEQCLEMLKNRTKLFKAKAHAKNLFIVDTFQRNPHLSAFFGCYLHFFSLFFTSFFASPFLFHYLFSTQCIDFFIKKKDSFNFCLFLFPILEKINIFLLSFPFLFHRIF